jgi:hypothetical protein
MDMVSLGGAVQGLTHLKNLASVLINEKNEMVVRERVLDILTEIDTVLAALFQAREDASRMQHERDELAQKVRDFEDWKATEQKYQLKAIGYAMLRESVGEPHHFVCPACFSRKLVIPLQPVSERCLMCPGCDKEYMTGDAPPVRVLSNFSR